ncbi:ATP-NAD kinase-like domain-containing protein [Chytridium lagenaria]|nr:ATP-NAD kinase-like domain-containing protein [Chytridium lagenaria]
MTVQQHSTSSHSIKVISDSRDPKLVKKDVEISFGKDHVSFGQDDVVAKGSSSSGGLIGWIASLFGLRQQENDGRGILEEMNWRHAWHHGLLKLRVALLFCLILQPYFRFCLKPTSSCKLLTVSFQHSLVPSLPLYPLQFIIAVTKSSTLPLSTLPAYAEKSVAEASEKSDPAAPLYIIIHLLDHGSVHFLMVITFEAISEETMEEIFSMFQTKGVGCRTLRPGLRKPVLYVMNPFGGVKEATKILNTIISPMMKIAGLPYEVKEEILRALDVSKYEAVIAVSGDGVFHEVVNGLMTRKDWEVSRQLPVGTIGAGSSNAMNRNLDCMFTEYGALNVVKVHYTHLNITWAYIADLDIESDRLRWLGREKTTVCAIIRLIWLRRYRAHLHVLPIDHEAEPLSSATPSNLVGPPRSLHLSDHTKWPIYVNPSKDPLTYFVAGNLPWVSTDFRASPQARLANGFIDVSFSERINRSSLLKSLLASELPDPQDVKACKESNLTFIKARGFKLLPLGVWSYGTGRYDGGDRLEEGQSGITVEVHPSLTTVVVPPWMVEGENGD